MKITILTKKLQSGFTRQGFSIKILQLG